MTLLWRGGESVLNESAENLNCASFLHSSLTYIATFPPPKEKSFISQINYLILDLADMKEPVNKNPSLVFFFFLEASKLYLRRVGGERVAGGLGAGSAISKRWPGAAATAALLKPPPPPPPVKI